MASLPTDRAQPRARQPEDELSLAELLQVVGRRRWLLLGCIFPGGLAGMAALGALTPVYDARALLIIEPDSGARAGATVPTASQTPDSASVDSQVQILASRSLAREAIQALGLAADPELAGSGSSGALAALLRRQTPPTPAPAVDVVARFIDQLSVEREGKSHVIAVSWRSADAGKAARVANKLAELYMAGQLTRKDAASRRQSGRLDAQLEALKGQLATAEATLAAYRAASKAGRAEMLGAEEGDISGLDSQLVAATVARTGKEVVLARLNRVVEMGSDTAAAGEVGGSPMLDNLLALKADLLRHEAELAGQYGQRHPKIVAIASEKAMLDDRIRTERRTLLQQYQGEVVRARAGEQVLARKLQELKGMALRREATAERSQELLREVELSRRLYESYLARASSEDQATDTVEPDARLISEAVPPTEPSFPKPKLILTLTLTAGFLLGLAAMYVAETGQRGLRSEREVTEVLGLRTLALVPRRDGARRAGIAPQDYALDRPRSRYAEALREILTGLLLRRQGEAESASRARV